MAPLLAALAASGLDLIGKAVLAKGKDVIEQKLGVDLDAAAQTPEGRLRLAELEQQHEAMLLKHVLDQREQDLRELQLQHANTADARGMNARIQEAPAASRLARDAAYVLDLLVVMGTVLLTYLLHFKDVPVANKELAYTAVGALLAHVGTILNFHRGTSSSSRSKDATIERLTDGARRA